MSDLTLGPVQFSAFEVPERIGFGGRQRLAVHDLPGGRRVIEALGRDDAHVAWSGTFSGPDAVDRAQLLDEVRTSGLPQPLAWDAFAFDVLVVEFAGDFRRQNWIPYRITCLVIPPLSAASLVQASSWAQIQADVTAAYCPGLDVTETLHALGAPAAVIPGTAAMSAFTAVLNRNVSEADRLITRQESALHEASTFSNAATAAGLLAQAAISRAYLSRARFTLTNTVG